MGITSKNGTMLLNKVKARGNYCQKRTEQFALFRKIISKSGLLAGIGHCSDVVLMLVSGFDDSVLKMGVHFAFVRSKDLGRERTECRTHTATRTSSKTAVRCSVGRRTRGNIKLLCLRTAVCMIEREKHISTH